MLLQASIEFFALISVLIVILTIVIYFNSSYYHKFNLYQVNSEAKKISDAVAMEINLALKAGDGYTRVFYIPDKILNAIDYEINISNYRVYVHWNFGSTQSVIYTRNVNGVLKRGENLIRNVNGEIYVN